MSRFLNCAIVCELARSTFGLWTIVNVYLYNYSSWVALCMTIHEGRDYNISYVLPQNSWKNCMRRAYVFNVPVDYHRAPCIREGGGGGGCNGL